MLLNCFTLFLEMNLRPELDYRDNYPQFCNSKLKTDDEPNK